MSCFRELQPSSVHNSLLSGYSKGMRLGKVTREQIVTIMPLVKAGEENKEIPNIIGALLHSMNVQR